VIGRDTNHLTNEGLIGTTPRVSSIATGWSPPNRICADQRMSVLLPVHVSDGADPMPSAGPSSFARTAGRCCATTRLPDSFPSDLCWYAPRRTYQVQRPSSMPASPALTSVGPAFVRPTMASVDEWTETPTQVTVVTRVVGVLRLLAPEAVDESTRTAEASRAEDE
jgi:hypothetical protein